MIPNTTISDYTTASKTYVTSTFSKFDCEEGFTIANTSVTKIECYADGKWMPERICIKGIPYFVIIRSSIYIVYKVHVKHSSNTQCS